MGSGFVGRPDELRRLLQATENQHSVSLVGDWRIGKTSLLAAFAERARSTGRMVRELSGEGPEAASLAAFIRTVTGRDCPLVQSGGRKKQEPQAHPDGAADLLSEWAQANTKAGLRPILVIDEVERMIVAFEHRFFERLRGMLERLSVVLCSRRDLDLVYRELGRTSPFHNKLALERLALLDSPAVETLVSWGAAVLDPADGSTIREWARCHPFYVQLLAYELAEARLNGHSTQQALDRFYDSAAFRLRDLWTTLNEREQAELRKAAAGAPSTSRTLRLRGLLTDGGAPFGKIVTEWLNEEQP